MRCRTLVPAVAIAALAAAAASGGMAGAEGGPPAGTLELVQRERDVRTGYVDAPPRRRESAGDQFTLSGPVRDVAGRVVGRAEGVFTQTSRRGAHGAATFLLRDGRVTVVGALSGSRSDALAIAGGTGAYSGARGTVTISQGRSAARLSFAFAG